MELSKLMSCLASGNDLPHYMVWFGEEQKIIDMYIDRIKTFYKTSYYHLKKEIL